MGARLKTNPWRGPRPASNPGNLLTRSGRNCRKAMKWEAWKNGDHEKYAIFCFAGKAAQIEYAGVASDEDAKADYDYSFVEYWLPKLSAPQRRIGGVGKRIGEEALACGAGHNGGTSQTLGVNPG
jgi:hypothetical protein